jgi:hypothetical protein
MPEISDAQPEANRPNAMLSTGPRTEEGRRRSSMNATKHGLTARTIVLPKADQQWRLRRIRDIEMDLLENGATGQELATLATYQQRILRVMRDAKRDLEWMQAERKREAAAKKTLAPRVPVTLEVPWTDAYPLLPRCAAALRFPATSRFRTATR